MVVLFGASLVLPDRILSPGTLAIDGGRIVDLQPGAIPGVPRGGVGVALHNHFVVPGFIDVHVHGIEGVDSLDEGDAIQAMAARLPRYGVTGFCPTTVACTPAALRRVLGQVRRARETPAAARSRVLPAHLESNFINPAFRGAQPAACLRVPREALSSRDAAAARVDRSAEAASFDAGDILFEIGRARPDVGIVTVAPELDGGIDLVRWLDSQGHRVSLGHSGASYEEGLAAIAAGARRATHLFNRMPPLAHRAPGLAGAVLQAEDVAVEMICDGVHVHPAILQIAVAAKHPSRVMAITDGTAAASLPAGGRARLGGQSISVRDSAAVLADGTMAGSVATLDGVFRVLVERVGLSLVDAAVMCATTPARELGLVGCGMLARDAIADLTVLDADLRVVQTYVGGELAYSREP